MIKELPHVNNEQIADKDLEYSKYIADAVDRRILEHIARFPSARTPQIAEAVGMTRQQVHKRMTRPVFKRHLDNLFMSTKNLVKKAQEKAMREAIKILDAQGMDRDLLKIKVDLIKTVMAPILNKGTLDINEKQEVIFRAKVGASGTVLQEVIEVEAEDPNKPKLIEG